MARIDGEVFDKESGQPIAGATVSVITAHGGSTGIATQTNSAGQFSLSNGAVMKGNKIIASSVGYFIKEYQLTGGNDEVSFELERNVVELPPVVVTGSKKNNALLVAGLILIAAKVSQDRRRVSGIKTGDVVAVGAGVALFLGFDVIKKMLEGLHIWDSKDTKDVDAEANNPNSPFSPQFYKAAPAGALLLTTAACKNLLNTLTDSFGVFDDDEAQAFGVFKQMKTQSQVSFFSDYFTKNLWPAGADLLTWLRGSGINDRLDDEEIADIVAYVNKLPKYKV